MENADDLRPLNFLIDEPTVSKHQLEIIKVIAKYSVLQPEALATRQSEFDFLHPQHHLHSLYQKLKHQYGLLHQGLMPPSVDVFRRAIKRAQLRATHRPSSSGKPMHGQETTDSPETRVDWTRFVTLEAIEFFTADKNGESALPPPIAKDDVVSFRYQERRKRVPIDAAGSNVTYFKSPYTGELVSATEYDEHVKVHEIDPKWRIQRAKEIEDLESTNLDPEMAAANLDALLAKRRKLLNSEQ